MRDLIGAAPRLVLVRAGDDPASTSYQRQITRSFRAHGLEVESIIVAAGSRQAELAEALSRLAADPANHGLLLQLPLPGRLRPEPLMELIPIEKDVEGLQPYHAGRLALGQPGFVPSTALAGLELLHRSHVPLAGHLAVVIGRSPVIGRPLASLLIQADATVAVCHSRTNDLPGLTRQADILLVAAGRPGLVHGDMVRPGATVIDFGTNEVDGRLVGDVDYASVLERAAAITPVPGGVGPVTTAVLARNLLQAARAQRR